MTTKKIMVKQWSFCPRCHGGPGCSYCNFRKTVMALVPLDSIHPLSLRHDYENSQGNFIEQQRKEGGK